MKRKRSSNHQEEAENIALEFQIGEISHFFDIPASTLRYWEEMQVLSPNKGETSHYREYAVEDLMTISDVIFYKNLGFQLKQIREMKSNTPKQQANLFEQKLSELLWQSFCQTGG
mgnify:FL=1